MSASIVPQLVKKDFRLMRRTILSFVLVSVVFIAILSLLEGRMPLVVIANLGFIMLIGPAATCAIVTLMKTNVLEKERFTQPFIMSLPVTVREFTKAKLLVNLPVFAIFWAIITGVAFYFAFGHRMLPAGAIPFVAMVFMGGAVAYALILSVSLLTQSLGVTVLCIVIFEVMTSGYMWMIAYFAPIRDHIWGTVPVWNTEAVAILAVQALVAVAAIGATLLIQNTKRDFI